MTLVQLMQEFNLTADKSKLGSDKASPHTYLQNLYEDLFNTMQECKSILEIGVWKGASCALWKIKFPDALVVGVDIEISELHPKAQEMKNVGKIELIQEDAYSEAFFGGESRTFDLIIDDGPHSLTSQQQALRFRTKLSDHGVLVIEDIQMGVRDFFHLKRALSRHERDKCLGISFCNKSFRYDDAVFIYTNSKEVLEMLKAKAKLFNYWGVRHPIFYYAYRVWAKMMVRFGFREFK